MHSTEKPETVFNRVGTGQGKVRGNSGESGETFGRLFSQLRPPTRCASFSPFIVLFFKTGCPATWKTGNKQEILISGKNQGKVRDKWKFLGKSGENVSRMVRQCAAERALNC